MFCDIQIIQKVIPPTIHPLFLPLHLLILLSHIVKSLFSSSLHPAVSSIHFLQIGAPVRQDSPKHRESDTTLN